MWNRVLRAVGRELSAQTNRHRQKVRPRVVELEDRAVPTTFFVTNTSDIGAGSLRQAIFDANNNTGPDDIQFTGAGASGTITLLGGQMTITDAVTITGPGASALTLSGNNTSRIFQVSPAVGAAVIISGLTLTKGNPSSGGPFGAPGGAIWNNSANLTVANSVITGNTAGRGGGIFAGYPGTTFTLQNSTVSGNTSSGPGGGVYSRADAGTGTTIEASTISSNQSTASTGGGISTKYVPLTIRKSTISGNSAWMQGGGLYVPILGFGTSRIEASSVFSNRSINSDGGGGYFAGGKLEVRNSTISGNIASNGGGLNLSLSTLTLQNSTVADNFSNGVGGGLFLTPPPAGANLIESSIVADNHAAGSPASDDVVSFTGPTSVLNSIDSLYRVTPAGGISGTNVGTIIADPQLGPLQDNGGPTWTQGIPSTSPAVDHGSNSLGLTTDQRGVGFDRSENGIPDIGAVEWDIALVTNTNDDLLPGSLRAAVVAANAVPDVTPIRFAPGLTGTITLSNGDVVLSSPVDLVGPGTGVVTVTGNAGNHFLVGSGASPALKISGLTLVNPSGFNFGYPVTATGDLFVNAVGSFVQFAGPLTAAAGTLTLATSNVAGFSAVLGSTTTLAGGNLASVLGFQVAGTLTGTGTMSGNIQFFGSGHLAPALNGAAPGQYDRLTVNGAIDLGTGTNFVPSFGFTPPPGTVFTLIDNDGTDLPSGKLNGIASGGTMTLGGVLYQVRFDGGDGNDVTLAANTAPVLKPSVTVNLNPILEDTLQSNNAGTSADALLGTGGLYSDAQGTLRPGMAVTAVDTPNGFWQYTLNGGATWNDFGSVSPTSATLLQADGGGQTRIRFRPNTDFFGTAAISFRAWDGLDGSPNGASRVNATVTSPNGVFGTQTATATINVLRVNEPPVAVNDQATLAEDGGAQTINVLTNDSTEPGETLTVTSVTQGLHGTVAIAGSGTSVTYTPDPDYAGKDTFLYSISDGNGGTALAAVTVKVLEDAADRLEVVTSDGVVTFTEGGGAVAVDAGVRVGSALEGVMTSATVRFASGYVKGKDKLFFTSTAAIKGIFSAATGTLMLTGAASPADYQAALRTVTYNNSSPLPVDGVRTLAFLVKDMAGTGDPATRLLRVIGVNTKPTATLTGAAINYTRGRPAVAVAGTLLLKDLDNTRLQSARVAITSGFAANQDQLTITTKPGITAIYDGATGVLTLTGSATLATYQAILRTLKFSTPAAAPTGSRTLSLTVNDGQLDSDAVSRTVNVV